MPTNKFVLPTGYESEQRRADQKRALAKVMLERGLASNPNMQSWTQVLAQLGSAFVGSRLNKKADKLDDDVYAKEIADYTKRNADFDTATGGGATVDPADIIKQFSTDPMLQDRVKPYVDALAHRLSQQENIVKTPTTYARQGDLVGKQNFDPNASVIPDGQGGFKINPLRTTAALEAQGYGFHEGDPMQTTMGDPTQGQVLPSMPPQYARPTPAPGDQPLPGALDTGLLSPDERNIMASELTRRAGHVSSGGQYALQNDTSIPMGSPITARKPPAGITTDGRPYWMVNGVAYDNPEGR